MSERKRLSPEEFALIRRRYEANGDLLYPDMVALLDGYEALAAEWDRATVGYVVWEPRLERIHGGRVYKHREDAEAARKDLVWHLREVYSVRPVAFATSARAATTEGGATR